MEILDLLMIALGEEKYNHFHYMHNHQGRGVIDEAIASNNSREIIQYLLNQFPSFLFLYQDIYGRNSLHYLSQYGHATELDFIYNNMPSQEHRVLLLNALDMVRIVMP